MKIFINTSQGDWSQIMHHSNGIDTGEVIVITGEHNDINCDYLLNLWGFCLNKSLYISYGRPRSKLINCWWTSRLTPRESEIDSIRYIECDDSFNVKNIERCIKKIKPSLVMIENIDFSDGFEQKIQALKQLAKSLDVAIIVQINPSYVNADTILNCSLLNKIYYFTNRSVYIYKSGSENGVKIATVHTPKYFHVLEDHSIETEQIKRIRKQQTQKQKFYDLNLSQDLIVEEKKKEQTQTREKAKDKSKNLKMTFGQ